MHNKLVQLASTFQPKGIPSFDGWQVVYYPRMSKREGSRVWALFETATAQDARIPTEHPEGAPPGWYPLFNPTEDGMAFVHPASGRYARSLDDIALIESGSAVVDASPSTAVSVGEQLEPFGPDEVGAGMAEALNELVLLPRVSRPPATNPGDRKLKHGWFNPSHATVLGQLLSDKTRLVVELGSWLGRSTKHILATAPNAVVIAIDLWSNRFVLEQQGDHYAKDPLQVRMLELFDLKRTFVANLWERFRDRLILMQMSTERALGLLRDVLLRHGVAPDVVYIDADHHHEAARRDIEMVVSAFPSAQVVGDDWEYSGVRRAAVEVAMVYGRMVHAQGGKCWTFSHCESDSTAPMDLEADDRSGEITPHGFRALLDTEPLESCREVSEATHAVRPWGEAPLPTRPSCLKELAYPSTADGSASSSRGGGKRTKHWTPPLVQKAADCVITDDSDGLNACLRGRDWAPKYLSLGADESGKLPLLCLAAKSGAPRCVDALLQAGADPNSAAQRSSMSALHYACYAGAPRCVELLLHAGANPSAVSKWGETPAQAAAKGLDVDGTCARLVTDRRDKMDTGYSRAALTGPQPAPSSPGASAKAAATSNKEEEEEEEEDLWRDDRRESAERRGRRHSRGSESDDERSHRRRHRHHHRLHHSRGRDHDDGSESGRHRHHHRRHRHHQERPSKRDRSPSRNDSHSKRSRH
jgi:hypothetical protein